MLKIKFEEPEKATKNGNLYRNRGNTRYKTQNEDEHNNKQNTVNKTIWATRNPPKTLGVNLDD